MNRTFDDDYKSWLKGLKFTIQQSQIKAALAGCISNPIAIGSSCSEARQSNIHHIFNELKIIRS